MGMHLSRLEDGELFECSNGMLGIIMASAYKTGWKPLVTFKMDENDNPDPNWDKNDYSSHQGQIVNETDAFELSKALKKYIEIEKEVIDTNEFSVISKFIESLRISFFLIRLYIIPALNLAPQKKTFFFIFLVLIIVYAANNIIIFNYSILMKKN